MTDPHHTQRSIKSDLLQPPPLVGRVESLIESILPRRPVSLCTTPLDNVRQLATEGYWEATSADPQFLLTRQDQQPFKPGWYYLEAALTRHSGNRVAKIYPMNGMVPNEQTSIVVPSNLRGSIREVFYLPEPCEQLRWDPMESPGAFKQSPLVLHAIQAPEAWLRMAARVAFDGQRFGMSEIRKAAARTTTTGNQLTTLYKGTALRRLEGATGLAYADFVARNDTLGPQDVAAIKSHIAKLNNPPTISVLVPVYNPRPDHLRAAIESVLAQLYPHWELCLADDASTQPAVRQILEEYASKDPRIKVVFRTTNGHISAASNSALEVASGAYVAFLDQDDLLTPQALYHVAIETLNHPDAELIYSDEDKILDDGVRLDPYFKPDWSPELFESHNMITHLATYRTATVRALGGLRLGYEGSQDYDLASRVTQNLAMEKVRHIPRVLYHWRIHEESTASSTSEVKHYAYDAAIKVLEDRTAQAGTTVEHGPHNGSYRVLYPIPEPAPLVSLIIPTRDGYDILKTCIESIVAKTTYPHYELIVVDNNSTCEKTLGYMNSLSERPNIKVVRYPHPFNYSAINNHARSFCKGALIGLVNNDVEVISPDWLTLLVRQASRKEIGAAGAKLLYPDGRVQHAGVVLGLGGMAAHAHRLFPGDSPGYCGHAYLNRNFSAVTGACLLVSADKFDQVGGLNEVNLSVAYNDVDFCLKLQKAGYRNVLVADALLIHHESISRGQEDSPEKQARLQKEITYMQQTWQHIIDRDPFYNPNLTTSSEDFGLNWNKVESPHHAYPLPMKEALMGARAEPSLERRSQTTP